MMLFATFVMCCSMWDQNVMQVVYAESDDGFVNIR